MKTLLIIALILNFNIAAASDINPEIISTPYKKFHISNEDFQELINTIQESTKIDRIEEAQSTAFFIRKALQQKGVQQIPAITVIQKEQLDFLLLLDQDDNCFTYIVQEKVLRECLLDEFIIISEEYSTSQRVKDFIMQASAVAMVVAIGIFLFTLSN